MVNYLHQLQNPQFKHEIFFEIMKDFRKGGLNPNNYNDFIDEVKKLPRINKRTEKDFKQFDRFNLKDITEDDFSVIMREVIKRSIKSSKTCSSLLKRV